jgi:hypothetical protein
MTKLIALAFVALLSTCAAAPALAEPRCVAGAVGRLQGAGKADPRTGRVMQSLVELMRAIGNLPGAPGLLRLRALYLRMVFEGRAR